MEPASGSDSGWPIDQGLKGRRVGRTRAVDPLSLLRTQRKRLKGRPLEGGPSPSGECRACRLPFGYWFMSG